MVPIRKGDGTTVVPDGIGQVRTGDGRILFEGDAIPENGLVHQYDATELSLTGGDPVSEWPDIAGTTELTQTTESDQPTYESSGLNGNPSVRFPGDTEFLEATFPVTYTQPNTVFLALEVVALETGHIMDSAGTGDRHIFVAATDERLRMWSGDWIEAAGEATTDDFVLSGIFDSPDSELRRDSNTVASGDTGGLDWDSIYLGRHNTDEDYVNIRVGELLIYDRRLDASEMSDVESYLADKWGIDTGN